MKKITLLAGLLFTGIGFSQSSAEGSATVNAEIVEPISITSSGTLDFGEIAQDASAGDVTLTATNSVSYTNSNMEVAGTTTTVPTFSVSVPSGLTYAVSIPDVTLTSGTNNMTLTDFTTSLPASTGASATSFTVGGTLKVGATQATGSYTGDVKVTVSYE
ncbi:MAG: DUF4402 domain-containing protein [Christiangramia sp.]|nr:hypothetical protein [Christiangramia sp.]